jgi:hypothetical protein
MFNKSGYISRFVANLLSTDSYWKFLSDSLTAVRGEADVQTKYQGYQKHFGNNAFGAYAIEEYELHTRYGGVQSLKQGGKYKHCLL